jgi:serine/threonine-protein kinase
MATGSSGTFFQSLCDSRLLNSSQRDELTRQVHQFPEARSLARHLLERNWLTPFQVNQLFLGRSRDLVMGSYIILERLGEGGTGQVFKARHQHMQRVVALKLIRAELLSDAEVVNRFYREVRVLSQLSHPNVVHAYDAGPIGATHFLVMEHVEGSDLGKLVKQGGPLSVEQACDYLRQAALGLEHAHQRGLVHRDIKPSNLLVAGVFPPRGDSATIRLTETPEKSSAETLTNIGGDIGVVKVLDLGLALLARNTNGEVTSTLTEIGSVTMGTPDYMAPEQALDFHAVDIRADIYSLGCTLYYLLTGQPPFPAGTMAQKLMRHQQAAPPPLAQYRGDVPPAVEAVLRRMLAKRPDERFQTPAEVVAALTHPDRAGKESTAYAVRSPDAPAHWAHSLRLAVPPSLQKALARPRGRRVLMVGSVAAGLLFAVVLGLALLLIPLRPGVVAAGDPAEKAPPSRTLPAGVTPLPATSARESTAKKAMASAPTPARPTVIVLPEDGATLLGLRPTIQPHPGEDRWAKTPWQSSLWVGRQKAAAAGKPLLLCSAHGNPLATTCATGIDFRTVALADPDVQAALNDFVVVACDGWSLDRQSDAEGEFYRKIAFEGQKSAPNTSSRIGIYCATPDGQYLGYNGGAGNALGIRQFLRKALADWNALPEERRRAGAVVEALAAVDPAYHPVCPAKGAVVNVAARVLEPDARGGWRPGTSAIGHDHMWVTDAECATLAAAKGNLPQLMPTMGRLLRRALRFHLVDNTRWESTIWKPEQVLARNLKISTAPPRDDRLTVVLEGPFAMASSPNLAVADRGYNGHMILTIVVDTAKEELLQFDAVAVGEIWDPNRQERAILGVAFELSRAEADRLVPPYGATRFPGEYIPPPGK